ncbi:MAG: hypothetical protein P8P56_10275 [Yoonia sp.]|nr:hypothetical protein [Yoonia sp.]
MRYFDRISIALRAVCVILPSVTAAEVNTENRAFSGDGDSYQMNCNDNGFVLTSD